MKDKYWWIFSVKFRQAEDEIYKQLL